MRGGQCEANLEANTQLVANTSKFLLPLEPMSRTCLFLALLNAATASSPATYPVIVATRNMSSSVIVGMTNGDSYDLTSCAVMRPSYLNQEPTLLENYNNAWPSATAFTALYVFTHTAEWDGSPVSLKMRVQASNATTIHVAGVDRAGTPPDSMSWAMDMSSHDYYPFNSEEMACMPTHCLLPENTTYVPTDGCGSSAVLGEVMVSAVDPSTEVVEVDVTSLLSDFAVLKVWIGPQVNTMVQSKTSCMVWPDGSEPFVARKSKSS